MIINIPTTTGFTVTNHPSREPSDDMGNLNICLYNKETRVNVLEVILAANWLYSDGVITFTTESVTNPIELIEGGAYYLLVTDDVGAVFNSNLFCTAQADLQDYEINKDDYTTPTQSSNEFLTY